MARRKRNDPGDAPIDGDLRRDQVHNKQKGFRYYLLTPEDAIQWRQWGAVKEPRGPESARPAFDLGDESATDYTVGGLTLYKIPEALAAKRENGARADHENRMKVIRRETKRAGGELVESTR